MPTLPLRPIGRLLLAVSIATALAACATPRRQYRMTQPPAERPAPVSSKVYFYPERGQSAEQQDRDRYECNAWAVKESGFDPSLPPRPGMRRRVAVVPAPEPGRDTAVGAVTGAMIGAVAADRHHSAEGAAVGALAGAVLGAISDQQRQDAADAALSAAEARQQRSEALERGSVESYRRAMSACLGGRGYTVR
ncbi:YMGG-like glycine zipper-containing protein [Chitinimonas koreensis]|uniref:YMGG-like glycine zipper-containing protein n=1 Tax=Chitinimonas koreensis TaxID=356302 RepID=UPI000404000E|nr:YMGG-like glycine zipper-containing protein [Chitinimonas koreensis]QNM96075.1 glycine zipper 2TM domain-containing protein [Chitinimonas koreensis]